ncbi:hypothetical protein ACFYWN_42620 [Streptomyces sp. NPDC002917]|uniref:hypothetical protein n=1 Tax=Streptomyces sp. NPDC002917 TaxID=3364671 RepID=UPI0036B9D2FD
MSTEQHPDTPRTPTSTADEAGRSTTPNVRGLVLVDRDPRYDRETGHAELAVEVCFLDGTKTTAMLDLDPARVLLLSLQLERAIGLREGADRAVSA